MNKRIRLAGVLAAILSAPVVLAEGAANSVDDPESIYFQEIPAVYGASKYEQKLGEAPSSVSLITAEEIKRYGHRTLTDILRSVRGFYTTYDRNYTYVGVRGLGRPGDYNTRVLLLIDGHRTNDNIFDQASIGTESLVEVDMIDRIEIVRGSSSSLYGPNAFFATINVITKRGRDLRGTEVAGELASYNTYKTRVSYGNRFENGREALVSMSVYDSKGQNLYFPEFNAPSTYDGKTTDTDGDRYKNFFAKLGAGAYTLEGGYVERNKDIPTASWSTLFNDPRSYTTDAHGFLSLRYHNELSDRSQLTARLAYDSYRYDGDYAYSPTPLKDYGYGEWWTGELQYTRQLGARHKLVAGAEFQYNSQQDQGAYDVNPYSLKFETRESSRRWAVFAQDEFRIRDNLIFNVGVRHDHYEADSRTNPRLALIYSASGRTAYKLLYGSAFRTPNAYEKNYTDGNVTQKGNPALKPETIQTYELAGEHTFRSGLRGIATLFYYRIEDLITQETDPADGLLVYRNTEKVQARGVEFELEGKLAKRLDGRVSYAYQNSVNAVTGAALTNSPRQMAKLNVNTPLWDTRLNAGVELEYLDRRRTKDNNYAGGYTVANLMLSGRPWHKRLELSAGVYNLFAKEYADPASRAHTQDVIQQDGRQYRLKLKLEL